MESVISAPDASPLLSVGGASSAMAEQNGKRKMSPEDAPFELAMYQRCRRGVFPG